MSAEIFDKKLSEKLEQIQPGYSASKWVAFSKGLPQKNSDKRWILPILALLLLLFSGYTAYQNFALRNKIEANENELALYQNQVNVNEKLTTEIQNLEAQKNQVVVSNESKKNQEILELQNQILALKNKLLNNEVKLQKIALARTKSSPAIAVNNEPANVISDFKTTKHVEKKAANLNEVAKDELAKEKQNDAIVLIEVNSAKSSNEHIVKDTIYLPRKVDSTETEKVPNLKKIASISKSNKYDIWMGASSSISRNNWSWGGLLEIQFFKHIKASLGLESANSKDGDFRDENEFQNRTNRNFRDKFKHGIPPNIAVRNIHSENSSIQLPIQVGYQFNIGNHWGIMPFAGMRLNLSNQNNTEYSFIDINGESKSSSILEPQDNSIMNNFSLGVAASYTWRRLVFRLEPNIQYSLERSYLLMKHDKVNFGMNAKVLFRIF
jgi:hypothetical protein